MTGPITESPQTDTDAKVASSTAGTTTTIPAAKTTVDESFEEYNGEIDKLTLGQSCNCDYDVER